MKTATTILGILTATIGLSLAIANSTLAANFQGGEGHSGGGVHGGGGRSSGGIRGGGSLRSSRDFRVGGSFRGSGGFRDSRGFHGFQRVFPYGYVTGVYGAAYPSYCAPPYYCYPYYSGAYNYSVAAPADNEPLADDGPPPAASPDQSSLSVPVQSPTTSVADVEAMSKAALNDAVIIGQIHNSHTVYHLSAAEIIDLKKNGVSQHIIEFMVNTPSS